ncbi:hypothetical protein QM012_000779 [Aureobasidium pullulans]|uniref:FMN hydroxy acid dehydrogenase domain-containing protein n=1 Tax=Aureobasidium pullulans TaxID=5580 RepID=A0ABR0TXB6_AURPU
MFLVMSKAWSGLSKPTLGSILNLADFEEAARQTFSEKAWAFISSAATDCNTVTRNESFFSRIWLRPMVLRNVKDVDTSTRILGQQVNMPLFVSPAGLASLVQPEGEKDIARGCSKLGVPQCISTNASFDLEEIVKAASSEHPFYLQLYVSQDRARTVSLLTRAKEAGITTIFLSVDAPVPGKREADERVPADTNLTAPMAGGPAANDKTGGGLARIMGSYIDSSLQWSDLDWLRQVWDGKIVIKGIQRAEDARRACAHGVEGIILSNHGGRALDTAPPAIMLLLECRLHCPEIFSKLEIFIDSGICRGTDIFKCLCLGATAVGLGRPFLYALNYGQEGPEHLIDLLQDELKTTMKLMGVTKLSECHPDLINTRELVQLVPEMLEPSSIEHLTRKAKL